MKNIRSPLRILLVVAHRERVPMIEQALLVAGHSIMALLAPQDDIVTASQRMQPDALVIDIEAPNQELLHRFELLRERQPLPIVVFAEASAERDICAAIRAGVSAYVVDGFRQDRIISVLDAAVARFIEFQTLRGERDEALAKLNERRAIERAKGILMRRRDLAEDAAYEALRKMAMNRGRRMLEVAESIITAEEMLNQR